MAYGHARTGAAAYARTGATSGVEHADPHQLIGMLLDGAIDRIAQARGHLQRGNIAAKGEAVSAAIDIVEGLRVSLNQEAGGELAVRLNDLYGYMGLQLLRGNQKNDVGAFDDVSALLHTIREGWQGIRADALSAETAAAS